VFSEIIELMISASLCYPSSWILPKSGILIPPALLFMLRVTFAAWGLLGFLIV
jgi:hypothetical protein